MNDLPLHPITGLQAIGIVGGKPVWPILGGSVDTPPDPDPGGDNPPDPADRVDDPADGGNQPKLNKFGYPEDTPLAEMDVEQALAYWKHQSRKHESVAKSLKDGLSAQEAQLLRDRITELESSTLSDEQRAHADAIEAAKAEAVQAARDELLPQLRSAELRGFGSIVLTGKKLDNWLDTVKADAFLDEDGHVDGEKVVAHLTEMYGDKPPVPGSPVARHSNYGQGQSGQSKTKRGDGGRVEAERRFGSKP
ncbi:hypothetical protein NONI108955_20830 [Nocardia ninae]|uniref:Scaffolding protein n=1 Tax=Nocardia ninae NBRC 108245 TaxID=1210091 RepID=A0A511MA72_9NOCA|nr:hypothetical protein [Nocardia ninae]GEM37401.1 hypothetical protein NN4_19200 [Nocardia ninae NBRC 108245]